MRLFARHRPPRQESPLEERTRALGTELLRSARRHEIGRLSAAFWRDRLVDWAMRDPGFKTQLFRFVDTYPALRSPEQVHAYLTEYLTQPGVKPPPWLKAGLRSGIMQGTVAQAVAQQVQAMAQRFIAGRNAADALPTLRTLWSQKLAFSVDLLGEACLSHVEADAYRDRYLDLIHQLPARVADWPSNDVLEHDHLGPIPRANVSIKISSLEPRPDPADFDRTLDRLADSLRPLLEAARNRGVFINFDMEQAELKDLTIALFQRCCEQIEFPAGLALQAYLRSGEDDAQRVIDWAKRVGRRVTVRLVKGAYWDHEMIHAEQKGWPAPVWTRKPDTDACFERMAERIIQSTPRSAGEGGVMLAAGSHNARSLARVLALAEHADLPTTAVEVQMLHGMADPLKTACTERGLRVREYVPVGEMIPGMAYLVRRLLENTSNESWLRAGFSEDKPDDELLASPHGEPPAPPPAWSPARHALAPAIEGLDGGNAFLNEPHRDLSQPDQREAFAAAVRTAQVPSVALNATEDDAHQVVRTARDAFPAWRDTPAIERAGLVTRAADLMHDRRDELAGIITKESGKPWRDADGDVCEAIDFCRFYARHAVELQTPRRVGRYLGERDEVWHEPRGVAAVISPWNFPLAICCGMTAAALVMGNTAVVKPAEQSPGIAKVMCDLLWQAGVPKDALHFIPGIGETVGAALVRDPLVAIVAFTGSKAVGLNIIEAAGHTDDSQSATKRVVCEMGGKNAIIVDSAADLDVAVAAVRASAFGYAGQKCSACSRAVVLQDCYDEFLPRLVESTRALTIGDPANPGTDVPFVIDAEAKEKTRRYIEIGRQEGTLELAMDVPAHLEGETGRCFVGPHIFSGIRPEHRLAQEEVFGPVLAVMKARDFDQALAIANATGYKLTGGVVSRRPSHLDRARREFRVGNLYLNRGITGSLVGRQPFGGFGLSGIGAKAGSREYLLQFADPRAVCENTERRGFAPDLG